MQDAESYASGSSDEERRLAKPVFVTKGDRETVLEKEKAELEEAQLKEDEQKRKESRQVRSDCDDSRLYFSTVQWPEGEITADHFF